MTAPTTPSPERQPADAGGGLLPCPMCDGPGHLQHTVQQLDDGWNVICHGKKDCPLFCSTPYRLHDTKAEARAAWNRRAPAPQAQPDARAVEGLIRDCAKQFRFYEKSHAAKGTPDGDAKAIVNAQFAQRCEDALSAPAADDGWRTSREALIAAIGSADRDYCDLNGEPCCSEEDGRWRAHIADAILALHPAAPTEYCPFCEYEEGDPRAHACGAAPTDEVGKT